MWREEHATAFTVAKLMQVDLLADLQAAVDKAIAEGQSFAQFRKSIEPTLRERGWWGVQEVVDPETGEVMQAQLGSPRRLRLIYDTNLRTAHAAGQWARIQRTVESHPYLLYTVGPSREHRPDHLAWHGTPLPVSDAFWHTHMPPNGFGCKCRVRQVSEREAEQLRAEGVPVPASDKTAIRNPDTGALTGHHRPERQPVQTEAPPVETFEYVNKRTGEINQVPRGIDPGWDTNPGAVARAATTRQLLTGKLDAADPALAVRVVRDLVAGPDFAGWMQAPQGDYPVGVLPDATRTALGAEAQTVRFSADSARKQAEHHPELLPGEYGAVQDALERGQGVPDGQSIVYLLEADGYVVVVKATRTGRAVFLTSLRRLSSRETKHDREVQRLLALVQKKG